MQTKYSHEYGVITMKCTKYGSLIPDKAKFCMTCGEPVQTKKVMPTIGKPPIKRKNGLIAMIIALLFVAAITSVIALMGKGDKLFSSSKPDNSIRSPVLRAPSVSGAPQPGLLQAEVPNPNGSGVMQSDTANPQSTGVMQAAAPKPSSAGVLQADTVHTLSSGVAQAPVQNSPSAGVMKADVPHPPAAAVMKSDAVSPPPQEAGPPADVVAYLAHVKKVEQYRQSMRLDLSPAMDMLTDAYSLRTETDEEATARTRQSIDEGYSRYTSKWQEILAYFNSVTAPESCQLLAGTYGDALSKYSSIMLKIQLSLSNRDISTLMALKGSAQKDVDSSLRDADAQVSAVCKTFGIKKTFAVEPDQGEDSLLSTGL